MILSPWLAGLPRLAGFLPLSFRTFAALLPVRALLTRAALTPRFLIRSRRLLAARLLATALTTIPPASALATAFTRLFATGRWFNFGDWLRLGLPIATEFLDPIVPQYIGDLVTWAAIGARTTESQTHREMTSGLSMPVGFKNGTDGRVQTAVDAMVSARHPHSFLGIDQAGMTSVVKTTGNPDCHLVLRGGIQGPNYEARQVAEAVALLTRHNLPPRVMVDCSHANSNKDPHRQIEVWKAILAQRAEGAPGILGAMLESFLASGNQPFAPAADLRYGQSITDACLGWDETETLLREASVRQKPATLESKP